MSAIGIDGNDGMYPITFDVCEGETKNSWSWFLELLLIDIGPVRECGLHLHGLVDQSLKCIVRENSL